jgi:hypothetical protein
VRKEANVISALASLSMLLAAGHWLRVMRCALTPERELDRLLSCIVLNAMALSLWITVEPTARAFRLWLGHGVVLGLLLLMLTALRGWRVHKLRLLRPVAGYLLLILLIGLLGPAQALSR